MSHNKTPGERDLDRIYWTLVVKGPMTLYELQEWTNWTKARTNDSLHRLTKLGCARLVERNRHQGGPWFNHLTKQGARMRCGKWKAITECEIVDAELIPV